MKRSLLIILIFLSSFVFLTGNITGREKIKLEIMEAEQEFTDMAAEKGIKEAFLFFAAEDAAIMRNNKVYIGKEEISKYFDSVKLKNIKLKWKPDFIDVSSSGDLAYTYGKFTFSAQDESGKAINSEGIFHTVWKKQANGKWKYVWD